jgi:exopolysaccharide production protein ExoQ
MAPKLALLLCIGFILYLFYTDSKHNNVSVYLWIPLIWLIIIASRLPSYWFNPEAIQGTVTEMDLEGSIHNRFILSFLILLGLSVLVKRKVSFSATFKDNRWIFIFFAYCAVSIMWSDFPYVSFKRYMKEIGNIIMVLIVLSENDYKDAIKTLIRRCAYVLIPLSVLFIKFFPTIGRGYHRYTYLAMYNGAAISKNALALLCLVCGLFFLFEIKSNLKYMGILHGKKKLILNTIIFISTLWLLIKADSSNANVCFVLGIATILFMYFARDKPYEKTIFIILIVLAPFLVTNFNSLLTLFIDLTESSETFWGRVENWSVFVNLMDSSPLIGEGYNSYWLGERSQILREMIRWGPTEAHSGYVETYLELGIIGLILLAACIVSAYKNIKERLKFDIEKGIMLMMYFPVVLAYNIAESGFKGLHLMWFIFLLFAVKNQSPSETK